MGSVDGLIAISSTSCLTYVFDSTQLSMQYLNNSLLPSTSKPTLNAKTSNSISIASKDQSYLTLGVYQYINVSYSFKNK